MAARLSDWDGTERRREPRDPSPYAAPRAVELVALSPAEPVPAWDRLEPVIELERALWRDTSMILFEAFLPLAIVTTQVFGGEVTARMQAMDPATNYGAF